MGNKLKEITKFVENHTDEQCGLEVANVSVFDHFGTGPIIIIESAKKLLGRGEKRKLKSPMKGMRTEWQEQAKDLIKELNGDPNAGYGGFGMIFELWTLSNRHFELREKEIR